MPHDQHHSAQENEEKKKEEKSSNADIEQNQIEAVEQELAEAQQKASEYLSLLQRTQADFINYKRRVNQEQSELMLTAQANLISQLLPALDDLGRALSSPPAEISKNAWVQGIGLVARQFTISLQQIGLKQIGTPGEPFNPLWHEAISTEARSDIEEGTIVHVVRPGYMLKDRVIRPAQVVVAGTASTAEQRSE
ncbi:molecular chaperone GrpE [Thermosporothrix hazakensis]|jgi:molecular chaperone GrpE|uniref:Protein GrpE n=1 Tax=Thermosporothrix hazakensis TaxID=644383 RepID=A0A326U8L4_THEHA|nr:nucleotide exchange factor GrpE [Thermosporothrix hazakensis]PZW30516.1 molecular chaperone GrpE [Thermosporothrix hazakensis]GCE49376.1 hypothetical protein KTH_42450 [Thermosporothrix hazakensis]